MGFIFLQNYVSETRNYGIVFVSLSVSPSIRNNQQMQLYAVKFIPLLSSLYMFRAAHTPIIRSTTIYSHWYNRRLA